jgi:KipI family sensor histidine kinase inhibitor
LIKSAQKRAQVDDDCNERVRIRRVGRSAILLEVADSAAVAAWHAELCRRQARGELSATEVVPAARTILLDGVPHAAALEKSLASWPEPAAVPARSGTLVTVPTIYDGPDLADVARRWNTSLREAIRIHSSIEFRVAFCGFAPGFAYLTGLPARLQLPRHAAPRVRVPAGSVALAGEYAAIYPSASPGGWQLIGRTDLVLFDLAADPPTTLLPGTRVRFVEADQ